MVDLDCLLIFILQMLNGRWFSIWNLKPADLGAVVIPPSPSSSATIKHPLYIYYSLF